MDVFLVLINALTVIIAAFVCYYSFKLVLCLNAGMPSNWWGLMPIAFLWAASMRVLVLLVSLEILPVEPWSEAIAASQIVFWGLILVFKVGFYRELKNILFPMGCK